MKIHIGAFFRKVSEGTKWSVLAHIGGSLPAKVAILTPLVGYLIIFNDYFVQAFSYGELNDISQLEPITFTFSMLRLNFLYFGLLFVGIAASVYSIFSPRQISHFRTPENFILIMEQVKTEARTISSFELTVNQYFFHSQGETASPFFDGTALQFPEAVQEPLFRLAEDFLENIDFGEDGPSHEKGAGRFHTGSGYVNSEEVLDMVNGRRAVDKVYWSQVLANTFLRSKDVFYLEFLANDYSHAHSGLFRPRIPI